MFEFTAEASNLKKALAIASLSVDENQDTIEGHALFTFKDNKIFIHATNKDKISVSYLPIKEEHIEHAVSFTVSPKRLQAIINKADEDLVKFKYDPQTSTLNVYASEEKNAYVSFASFNPEDFPSFIADIAIAKHIKDINSTTLLMGIRFIQGFLPGDDKSKKYSNLYIDNGILYGSNGANKVGAFTSSDLEKITGINIRRIMLIPVSSFIDKISIPEVILKASSKSIILSSPDGLYQFGFRKSILELPKLPISIDIPTCNGINIDRNLLLKKITRLALTTKEEIGLKMSVKDDAVEIHTTSDRESYEKIGCTRISGTDPFDFIIECKRFRSTLTMFQADYVNMYIDKTRCTIYNNGDLIFEEAGKEPVKKSFVAVGVITLARPE